MKALPHEARLMLTGWATPTDTGLWIAGLHVRTERPLTAPARLTVTTYPRTRADGTLYGLYARARQVRPAKGPNGTHVIVTGQILKLDRGLGIVKIKVCPAQASCEPFAITLHATREVLHLDPHAFHARVTGRVLPLGRGHLLAERAEIVHAPVPDHWHRWRPKRSATHGVSP